MRNIFLIIASLWTLFTSTVCSSRFDLSNIRTKVQDASSLDDRRDLQEAPEPVIPLTNASKRVELDLLVDPPEGFFSPSALGVFLRCTSPGARVFWTLDGTAPTRLSSYTTYEEPYVHINTPFRAGRYRILRAVATETWIDGFLYRSPEITRHYIVEASERPGA
jgi:hypothetical protein